jgi:hypothetical protein
LTLFLPQAVIMIGVSLLSSNTSSQGLSASTDKAHAAATLQFINMSSAALSTYIVSSWLPHAAITLPSVYLAIAIFSLAYWWKLRNIRV